MIRSVHCLLAALFFGTIPCFAQPSLQKMQQKLATEKQNTPQSFYKFELNSKMPMQAGLLFSPDVAVQKNNLQQWLADKLELRSGTDAFNEKGQPAEYGGTKITKLQQFYKGIKVEHGIINAAAINDGVRILQMEFYSVPDNLPTVPMLTEDAALQKAMHYVGAKKYVWEGYTGTNQSYKKPTGELVIVEDMFSESDQVYLAYKFNIYSNEPERRDYIYVDAVQGKIVFKDAIVKHTNESKTKAGNKDAVKAYEGTGNSITNHSPSFIFNNKPVSVTTNSFGLADTRYSGQRTFFTSPDGFGQYELKAGGIGNNTLINTLNCLNQPDYSLASPVKDNDNVWLATEFPNNINMALDVHWAAEKSVQYWWQVHGRKSYDNNNGSVYCYTFYRSDINKLYDNAKWNGEVFSFGEGGFPPDDHRPWASIDIVSHEIGHAVCQYTANLVYARESGALNEGFSDIWGSCLKNFVKDTIAPLVKDPWLIGDEITYSGGIALRSMDNPQLKQDPDTYLDVARKWEIANITGCPEPIGGSGGNDDCGVHTNSGVLNKWFNLISKGGTGLNGNFTPYTVDSMGFIKTQKIAFYTEQILTPNSGFEAARIASLNATLILASSPNTWGITANDTANIKKAWVAVGVINDSLFKKTNTPVFLTDTFTSIGVGKNGVIWAGTSNKGFYRYNGREWQKAPNLADHNIASIKADAEGRLWIAQYGRSGSNATGGGISCYSDSSFGSYKFYSISDGLPTRNIRSLFVDKRLLADTFQRVWAAAFGDIEVGVSRPGCVVRGNHNYTITDFNYKSFKKVLAGVNPNNGFCQAIDGNETEVWVAATSNSATGGAQILKYSNDDSTYSGFIDNGNTPIIPVSFNPKAIYYDAAAKRWWIGMSSGGLVIRDSSTNAWMYMDNTTLFPAGTLVNNNAITGDAIGNVYIGTNNGLVRFGSSSSSAPTDPANVNSYTRYTMADGMPSNNVKAIAVDNNISRLLIATDSGIYFKYNLCKECINAVPVFTIAAGNWNDPATWLDGKVPAENSIVIVRHPVAITQNTNCKSLKVIPPGTITVNANTHFNVQGVSYEAEGHH